MLDVLRVIFTWSLPGHLNVHIIETVCGAVRRLQKSQTVPYNVIIVIITITSVCFSPVQHCWDFSSMKYHQYSKHAGVIICSFICKQWHLTSCDINTSVWTGWLDIILHILTLSLSHTHTHTLSLTPPPPHPSVCVCVWVREREREREREKVCMCVFVCVCVWGGGEGEQRERERPRVKWVMYTCSH